MSTESDMVRIAEEGLERAKKQLAYAQTVRAILPEGMQPKYIHQGGYLCEGSLAFEGVRLEDVPAMLEAMPGVPVSCGRGTFVTLAPADRLKAGKGDKYDSHEDAAPFVVTFEQGDGYGTESVSWWWQATPDLLLKVECRLVPGSMRIHAEGLDFNRATPRGNEPKHSHRINRPADVRQGTSERQRYWRVKSARWEWYFGPGQDFREAMLSF